MLVTRKVIRSTILKVWELHKSPAPGDSKWPFYSPVGGHLTIPKRSLWITRHLCFFRRLAKHVCLFSKAPNLKMFNPSKHTKTYVNGVFYPHLTPLSPTPFRRYQNPPRVWNLRPKKTPKTDPLGLKFDTQTEGIGKWSCQIIIFHQPRFPWNFFGEISLTFSPPFGGPKSLVMPRVFGRYKFDQNDSVNLPYPYAPCMEYLPTFALNLW